MVVPTQQQIHDLLNLGAFKQLLEMDDPEDEIPFSREITGSFFEQARSTLVSMDGALSRRDVIELGRLGHYLKGSSAVIGLRKVTTDCERIQILGNGNGNNEHATSDRDKLLENMGEAIVSLRANIVEAEPFIQSVFNALENNQVEL
ncbi:histidine-phosphotransfer domain, HPT domain-containing protein [Ramicandelaber brevisporus]|nr:histidine-phosphotransfer domain, HPT domain-containing protein [Ramicandelaber brevisporus]